MFRLILKSIDHFLVLFDLLLGDFVVFWSLDRWILHYPFHLALLGNQLFYLLLQIFAHLRLFVEARLQSHLIGLFRLVFISINLVDLLPFRGKLILIFLAWWGRPAYVLFVLHLRSQVCYFILILFKLLIESFSFLDGFLLSLLQQLPYLFFLLFLLLDLPLPKSLFIFPSLLRNHALLHWILPHLLVGLQHLAPSLLLFSLLFLSFINLLLSLHRKFKLFLEKLFLSF